MLPINTLFNAPSTHPFNARYQLFLSVLPINTFYLHRTSSPS